MKESDADFSGKYATQITISKRFYGVSSHRYMEDNFHDMGMKVVHGLSADMDDLTTLQGQRDDERFFKYLMLCINSHVYESKRTATQFLWCWGYDPCFTKKSRNT